jgi:hypothetical protein
MHPGFARISVRALSISHLADASASTVTTVPVGKPGNANPGNANGRTVQLQHRPAC